jgi:hypothetical protein
MVSFTLPTDRKREAAGELTFGSVEDPPNS